MNLNLTPEMSFESMTEVLTRAFPNYQISLKKNPIMRWQYVEVRKSASVGVWIRTHEKKNRVQLIKAIPSAFVRGMFGGLILLAFINKPQNVVRDEVGNILMQEYGTAKQ